MGPAATPAVLGSATAMRTVRELPNLTRIEGTLGLPLLIAVAGRVRLCFSTIPLYTATRSTLTSPERSNSELAETISSTTR